MPLGAVIALIILAVVVLVVISYMFRDSFFLFEGVCIVFDALGGVLAAIGDGIGDTDFGGDD